MPAERRYDAAQLSTGVVRDKRGFVSVPAFVTRTGVLTYRRADGTVLRELRHPDEVFAADSLATLTGAPVTIGHPGGGMEWVTPDNAHTHEVGVVSEGKRSDKFVDARLSVRRADAIKRIDSRELVEVSAAYDADVIVESGSYEGAPYDQRQTNITYNHVALLPPGQGRCGADVRMRADSADAVLVNEGVTPPEATPRPQTIHSGAGAPEGDTMATRKIRVDGVEHELPDTAASVVEKLITERDGEKKRADGAEAERDVVRGELTAARDPKALSAMVGVRVDLERAAGKVLGADKRFDGETDRQIREAVLKVTSPTFKTEGRSDDAVTAAFDYATAHGTPKRNAGLELVRGAIDQGEQDGLQDKYKRADGSDFDLDKELSELETKRANAWKAGAK